MSLFINCMQKATAIENKLVIDTLTKFFESTKTKRLLKKADDFYLLKSFKIKNINTKQILEGYKKMHEKYQNQTLPKIPEEWHKNQRKIFIWFLICYCQVKQKEICNITKAQWQMISDAFFQKTPKFLEFQGFNLLKNAKRYIWNESDDAKLKRLVQEIGLNDWNQISKLIFFQSENSKFISPKQCRQRWFNHVNNDVNKGSWQKQEDIRILELIKQYGKRWAMIAQLLNTNRTEHMIKNRYNSIMNTISHKKRQQQQRQLIEKALKGLKEEQKMIKSQNKQFQDEDHNELSKSKIQHKQIQNSNKKQSEIQSIKISVNNQEKQIIPNPSRNGENQYSHNNHNMSEILSLMAQNNPNGGFMTFQQFQQPQIFNTGETDQTIFTLTPRYKDLSPMDPIFLSKSNHSYFFPSDMTPVAFRTPTPTNTFSKSFRENTPYFMNYVGFVKNMEEENIQGNPEQE